ncbi:lysyl oxidase homolog 3-like [Antedon mediterranea]|uniref:lysyl oxidase homolog 3-like n=1 Tax=Antedon mediterranea TaxID=105859 RepID=UPI003AF976E9
MSGNQFILILVVFLWNYGSCQGYPKVRLSGSSVPHSGRVEIFHNGAYGTVCDDGWTIEATHVVCRELGFRKGETFHYDSIYGPGGGEILLDNTRCRGDEASILDCDHNTIGRHDCTHAEDIAVTCISLPITEPPPPPRERFELRLRNPNAVEPIFEGILEMQLEDDKWRTICADDWNIDAARVACGHLGFKTAYKPTAKYKNKDYKRKTMIRTSVECVGTESLLSDCEIDELEHRKYCKSRKAVALKCEPAEYGHKFSNRPNPIGTGKNNSPEVQSEQGNYNPEVRIKAGAYIGEGRVEVFHAGKWGTVCNVGWNLVSASVVCRQLGFGSAKEVIFDAGFGQGIGPVWLWNINCKGNEKSILDCYHGSWNGSSCTHYDDVGVRCNVPKHDLKKDVRIAGGRWGSEGRVEVKVDNTWGYVCGDSWNMLDALVVCRQLGLGYARQSLPSTRYYGNRPRGAMIMSEVHCTGKEWSLMDCPHTIRTNTTCSLPNARAGVICDVALPDVILDVHRLREYLYLQDLPRHLLRCAAEEGCLSEAPDNYGGSRRLIRFSSVIMNRGLAVFKPFLQRNDWVWHACHLHFHSMEVFSTYDLISRDGEKVAEGHKASFCLEDTECDPGHTKRFTCTTEQGISVNCKDNYKHSIDCQWIDITGVKSGNYILKIHVNPDRFVGETDYDNNEIQCELYYSGYSVSPGRCHYSYDL